MADMSNFSSDSSSDFSDFSSDSDDLNQIVDEGGVDYHNQEEGGGIEVQVLGIEPYMFEPDAPADIPAAAAPDPVDPDIEREAIDFSVLRNWCTCDNCQVMPKQTECICCRSIDRHREKMMAAEGPVPTCITDHRGFENVCLDKDVLEVAWYGYRQQYGRKVNNGPEHRRHRHIAYRQLVRWVYGYLGKEIKVLSPKSGHSFRLRNRRM